MKHSHLHLPYCIAAIALSALAALAAAARQPDAVERFTLDVGRFSSLVVEDSFNVVYHAHSDSAGLVTFDAPRSVADKIIFENNAKGRLTIVKAFHERNEMMEGLPVLHVYSDFLTEVKNSGDSTVRVMCLKPTAELKASVMGNGRIRVTDMDVNKFSGSIKTGNGTLTVSGRCNNAVLSNTGTGTIQADELQARRVSCRFFGNGTTGCWCVGDLTVKGTGGSLFYRGSPANLRNFSVGVDIISIDTGARFK